MWREIRAEAELGTNKIVEGKVLRIDCDAAYHLKWKNANATARSDEENRWKKKETGLTFRGLYF